MTSGIYKIENKITHKVYIGQSVNIEKRWQCHINSLNKGTHFNRHLQKSWIKYGKDSFIFKIIEKCSSDKNELNKKETKWTLYYYPNVYNLGATGNSSKLSYETKQRISKAVNAFLSKLSDKEKKIKFGNPGKLNPRYGKHLSTETKLKISKVHLGKKGYKRTPEILLKQDIARNKTKIKIVCYDLDMNFIKYYNSISQAARDLKLDEPAISNCCRGLRKRVHNYIFKKV